MLWVIENEGEDNLAFQNNNIMNFQGNIKIFRATFVDNLLIDTGAETTGKLDTLMLDRMVWRRVIMDPWAAPADPP